MILSDWIAQLITPVYATLLMEGGAGFLLGICIGFVTKNFGRTIAYFIVALWILMMVLAYSGIVTIHYETIKTLIGMPPQGTFDDALRVYADLFKLRIVGVSSGMIGTVIGWRVA